MIRPMPTASAMADPDMPEKISDVLDQGAHVIIIEGLGANFCAGADISEFSTVRRNEETARTYETANADAFSAIAWLVAAVPPPEAL